MSLPIRNSRIRLSQGQLFWREVGQGKTLVFLHGSWGDGNQWLETIAPLSRRYHCVAPDLLGFGESEQPNLHYSIELQVECLAEYLETLKLRQVYLIGDSIGAWIATSYALRFPDQVKGLVVLNPEGVAIAKGRWSWARWLTSQPPIAFWVLRALLPVTRLFDRHRRIQELLLWRRQWRRSPVACKLLFRRRQAEIQAELLGTTAAASPETRLQWLKLPVLLLQGKDDSTSAATQAQIFAREAPHVEVCELPETSETLLGEQAIAVVEQIDTFVQRLEAP
jgi:pimeloyl-ACP methyl ester carboxylesterase